MPRSNSGRREIINAEGPFSLPQVARLARLPMQTLRRWSQGPPRPLISPGVHESSGRGDWALFSFADVVAIKTVAELRRAGASLQCLRRVASYLRKIEGLEHPFAQARLVVVGDEVVLVKGDREAWGTARRPGQGVFGFVLDLHQIAQNLRDDAERHASRAIA